MASPYDAFSSPVAASDYDAFSSPVANASTAPQAANDAAPASENVFQRALRIGSQAAAQSSEDFKADVKRANQTHSLIDQAKPVLDAFNGTIGAVAKGVLDATFGDKPIALPGGVNSKGLTGGDIAGFLIPGVGEVNAARKVAEAAKAMGVSAETAKATLAASKGITAPLAVEAQSGLGKALAPYTAAVSENAVRQQAGQKLAEAATDPQAALNALQGDGQIIPGSQPTTFQQTGDMGLGALERQAARDNPAEFQQRAADQNSARREVLASVQPEGDPNDVAKALKQQFDDLDKQTDQHVQQLTQEAQAKAARALGPEENPETTGQAVRQALSEAEGAARQRERGLWKAVDPNGDLTGNVQHTSQTAADIRAGMAPTAKPMAGEEAAIFDAAESLPPLAPVSDLIALRSRVSTEMRNELMTNGQSAAYARLTGLRQAIQDNLSHSISQEVANEGRLVAKGVLDPSDTVASRLQSWADEWHAQRTAGPGSGEGVQQGQAGGSPATAGILRTESPTPEGQGSPSGAPGLSQSPGFDEAASQRLAAATQATKERAQTFGAQPVSSVLQTAGTKDQFKLPDGSVASKFFHPGKAGYDHMQALLQAAGEDVIPIIERYAATTLRRAALSPDGTLDPAKFQQWQKAYADSLRALPAETRAKYASASKASEALADAQALRTETLKAQQQSAIGKVMGLSSPEEVIKTVGQLLTGRTAVSDIKVLAKATAADPAARQGLRRAITEFIARRLVSNTEAATSGEGLIKADAYQSFIRDNRAALHLVFTPEEVRTMEAVAEDIQRAKRSQNAVRLSGGSNTAQDTQDIGKRIADAAGKSWLHVLGGALGAHFGPLGAGAGVMTAHFLQALQAKGVARVDQLVSEAMLDPKLARALLTKAPRKSANWNAGSAPVTAALWGSSATQSAQEPTR